MSTVISRISGALVTITLACAISACGSGGDDDSSENARPNQVEVAKAPDPTKAFGTTSIDLPAKGYIEEEFFVSGTAKRYRIPDPLKDAEEVDANNPYTTRILVRRPTNPAQFNGTVLVEWLNVTLGQDLDLYFTAVRDHAIAQGYAWVGVSVQRNGVNALKRVNPDRYGALSVEASNKDPVTGNDLDATGDTLAYDIYAQIGAALRAPGAVDPLGGLKVGKVFAVAESQSATRIGWYYNSVHTRYKEVFDAFSVYDCNYPTRRDLDTKFIAACTELGQVLIGQTPDSSSYRLWQIAGASHLSYDEVVPYLDEQFQRNKAVTAPDGSPITVTQSIGSCDTQPLWSRVPNSHVVSASLQALQRWVDNGIEPPPGQRFALDQAGAVVKDEQGRVVGGVRLAAYDAPRATNSALNTGSGSCILAGSHVDFTPQEMCTRYGSQANYVSEVTRVTRQAERDGYVLKIDADRTIREAEAFAFSCGG